MNAPQSEQWLTELGRYVTTEAIGFNDITLNAEEHAEVGRDIRDAVVRLLGFTHEHVELLRHEAAMLKGEADWDTEIAPFLDLADRLAALLPPPEEPTK